MATNLEVNYNDSKGVGFYIGEPCKTTCNKILFSIYCNMTTGRCECKDEFPVNIRNKSCIKGAQLGDACEHTEACQYFQPLAECEEVCRCSRNHQPATSSDGSMICTPAVAGVGHGIVDNSNVMTMISVVVGLVAFVGLICLALRLFSKARFSRPQDRMASAAAPSVVLSRGMELSRTPSRGSDMGSRRASYSMLAPPSSAASRRASSSSIRSQASIRSQSSSFRSSRGVPNRDNVRRTVSTPVEAPHGDHHRDRNPYDHHHHHHHHSHNTNHQV